MKAHRSEKSSRQAQGIIRIKLLFLLALCLTRASWTGAAVPSGQRVLVSVAAGKASFADTRVRVTARDQEKGMREASPLQVEVVSSLTPAAPRTSAGESTPPPGAPIEEIPPLAPQAVGAAFAGISLQDQFNAFGSGSIPPDTMGAVGPNHFVEIINSSVAIYSKTGTRLSHVSLDSFFTLTIGPTIYPRNGSFDPRVLFDRRSGRYFATTTERGAIDGRQNGIVLAVSRTSDATGVWDKYFLDVGDPKNGNITYFTDYPTLGVDDNGVYLGMRMFPSAGNSVAKIVATAKASLLAPAPSLSTVFQFNNITDMYSTPQPAVNFGVVAAGAPAFFVASSSSVYADVHYRTLTWSGGTPTLSGTTVLSTPSFATTSNAPALSSTTPINTGDQRLQMAVIRDGLLWTARAVGLNSTGGSTGADRTGCEWLQFSVSGNTLALAQSGRVFDSAASDPRFYYYPSIMVSGQGHATMGFSGSKSTEYVGAYFTGRLASDTAGTMGSVTLLQAGAAAYTRNDGSGRNRWGDYSATVVDPVDPGVFWTFQEFVSAEDVWSTRITQLVVVPERYADGIQALGTEHPAVIRSSE